MTMAFATLTLARLFHGFNCRGERVRSSVWAWQQQIFPDGVCSGGLCCWPLCYTPFFLETLFQVAPLTLANVGMIVLIARPAHRLHQIFKVIRDL